MELPPTVDDQLDSAPAYLRRVRHLGVEKQPGWVGMFGTDDHELVKEAIAATYDLIEMIDDGVGQILAALDRLGQADDTIVVFTSDHGDMMGDHGLMVKGFMHYRGTLQVPMVVADPASDPGRTTALAGSIDLPTTLLARAGLPRFEGMQGHDLGPILDAPEETVRDHLLIEDDVSPVIGRITPLPEKTRSIICADGLKYTRHSTGEDQLFDLAADRDETTELSGSDTSRRALAMERLADALIEADDNARGAPAA